MMRNMKNITEQHQPSYVLLLFREWNGVKFPKGTHTVSENPLHSIFVTCKELFPVRPELVEPSPKHDLFDKLRANGTHIMLISD
jgi:hypothetical protein